MAKPLKVLMVEDSERDAALLRLYLRRAGFDAEVRRVDTEPELATQLQETAWDIVISDFNLPGFNAFGSMKLVRESGREVPVVVLSGELSPTVIEGIVAAGSRYVSKFEMREIVPIIESHMQDRS
jgi:DNA-binding response OmpR family regulator